MRQTPFNDNDTSWALPPRAEMVLSIRINPNTVLALLVSVLLHVLLLWIFAPKLFSMGAPKKESPPFEITLGPPQKKEVAQNVPSALPQEPIPERLPERIETKPKKIIKEKSKPPKQIEIPVDVAKKSDSTVPKTPEIKKALPKEVAKATSPDPLPGEDMQAYIKRQKEAKLAEQGASKQDVEEVLATNNPQSAGEKRDAKIKENLNFNGTNGIFTVRELGLHSAQFSFKGWKNNENNARLEIIDVSVPEASDTEEVQQAVIRKMIEIIRREYTGDFQWDSYRLGRALTLSARLEDNAALEKFMMIEIFGPGSRVR